MKKTGDFKKMFFSYKLLKNIQALEKSSPKHKFGASMKYGKMAIISAIGVLGVDNKNITIEGVDDIAKKKIKEIESKWGIFIHYATKKPSNKSYITNNNLDQDVYYKGSTVNSDIQSFFKKKK